jgi:hypothetical protein
MLLLLLLLLLLPLLLLPLAAAAAAAAAAAERWARGGGSCWVPVGQRLLKFGSVPFVTSTMPPLHRGVLFLALFLYRSTVNGLLQSGALVGPNLRLRNRFTVLREKQDSFVTFCGQCSLLTHWGMEGVL